MTVTLAASVALAGVDLGTSGSSFNVATDVSIAIAFVSLTSLLLVVLVRRHEVQRAQSQEERLERSIAELKFSFEEGRRNAPAYGDEGARVDPKVPNVPQVPDELVQACIAGECLLFAGAGVAVQTGLPSWRELLSEIVQLHSGTDLSDWRTLANRVDTAPNQVAEILATRLSRDRLIADVRELQQDHSAQVTPMLRYLSTIPFVGALTTNYDNSLERAFSARSPVVVTIADSDDLPMLLRDKRFVIVKLYGDLDQPETFVLTPGDYAAALGGNQSFERIVTSLLLSNSVLFLGVSAATIDDFFVGLRMHPETRTRPHYALLPWQSDFEVEEERLRGRFGIQVLPYVPGPGHPETVEFVARLADRTARRPDAQPPAVLRPALIEAVRLKNVGPFRDLHLDLDRQWNVLLGNNGSGKSTVLRAIALALCGDDERARSYGTRMLRAQTGSGFVEVTVAGDIYRSDLVRDSGGVTVKASRLTPLQTATWVIVGFPPVRGVTARNPPPSPETSRHPRVDDVLPLLQGVTDERLDDIKGWLVSQALRSEGGRGIRSEESAQRVSS